MTRGDSLERGGEPFGGLDAIQRDYPDQRGDARPGATALAVPGEERVRREKRPPDAFLILLTAIQRQRADRVFDRVRVHLDAAVVQERDQLVPVPGEVGELLDDTRFGRDASSYSVEPGAEGRDQRCRASLADSEARGPTLAADLGLDQVELGDAGAGGTRSQPFS
jgi:hypothetical protein